MSNISRGFTSHHTGTVPLCSTTGLTLSIERTSISRSLRRAGTDSYTDARVRLRHDVRGEHVRTIMLPAPIVTAAAFAPFGVLPPDEGDGQPTADLEFALDDGWVNFIEHDIDEIEVVD